MPVTARWTGTPLRFQVKPNAFRKFFCFRITIIFLSKPINFLEVVHNSCAGWAEAGWIEKLLGDVNFDCYVDLGDVDVVAAEWLSCTTPEVGDCVQLLPDEETFIIPSGTVTVKTPEVPSVKFAWNGTVPLSLKIFLS